MPGHWTKTRSKPSEQTYEFDAYRTSVMGGPIHPAEACTSFSTRINNNSCKANIPAGIGNLARPTWLSSTGPNHHHPVATPMPTYVVTTQRIINRLMARHSHVLEGRTTHLIEATDIDDVWNKARAHFYAPGTDNTIQIIAIEAEAGATS
jgi:hypothetical protein